MKRVKTYPAGGEPKDKDQKLPAIQFYPGDWLRDTGVQSLSFHDRGVWFHMILMMHGSERRGVLVLNGRAMTTEMIARLVGLDTQTFTETLTNLLEAGVASVEAETEAIMNRRMVRDENLRKVRTRAGLMGGNPALVKQNRTIPDKQMATPSSSDSVSYSESKIDCRARLPAWIPPEEWAAYLEMRQTLHAPLTERGIVLTIRHLERLKNEGSEPAAVLEQSVLRGWKGLFAVRSGSTPDLPLQAGAILEPEVIEARQRRVDYEECRSYWMWLSMSEKYKKENPRNPPPGWFEGWSPHETQL